MRLRSVAWPRALAAERRRSRLTIAALLAFTLLVGAVYLSSPVIQTGDGSLVVYESDSLIHEGTVAINQYGTIVNGFPCYRVGRRVLDRYPYGTPMLVAPMLAAAEGVGGLVGHNPAANIRQHPPRQLEKDLGSVLAAFCCLAMVLLARELTGRLAPALVIGVLFAFGTSMWSSVAMGLWPHGPLILLVTIALILLVRARKRDDWRLASASGLLLGAAFVVRPTAAAPIVLVGLYVLFAYRLRAAALYAIGVAALVLPSIAYNLELYHAALNPYYFPPGQGFLIAGLRPTFLTGLAGTMVSPARGLLLYSPFLVFALIGLRWPRRTLTGLDIVALAVILAIWVTTANTMDWPGGYSYGPRLLSDALPWFVLLLSPVADALTRPVSKLTRPVLIAATVLTLAFTWGMFVNARGAFSWSTQSWNWVPVDEGTHPARLWDWSDPPFLRHDKTTYASVYPYNNPPPGIAPGQQCVKG